jgi:uncharacterized protein YeaO (DUF488 family)
MPDAHTVRVGRVYGGSTGSRGARVLVDRIWPRGLSKEHADLDEWCKAVAPSTGLRRWYAHDPRLFPEFARRYTEELEEPERAEALEHLRDLAGRGDLTLLTATKDPEISEAAVLADRIRERPAAA